jgi:hypothetical protein
VVASAWRKASRRRQTLEAVVLPQPPVAGHGTEASRQSGAADAVRLAGPEMIIELAVWARSVRSSAPPGT